jgi:ribosomal protein S18 acetylase RimI-like enzyme
MEKGYVELTVGEDARSRIVKLTAKGDKMVAGLLPSWEGLENTVREIRSECDHDLLKAINDFESKMREKSLYQRYQNFRKGAAVPEIEYVPFHVKYREDWYEINHKWIDENFKMESADLEGLKYPEDNILACGGEIYFALLGGKAVGAVALKYHGDSEYELSKMGVKDEAQRMGIGKKLIELVVARYKARGGKNLFLETNSVLGNAIRLYGDCGFKHVEGRPNTPYSRADVCMEYQQD